MSFKEKFATLGHPNRIWVIPAIHGQAAQLSGVHSALIGRISPGDRIVYTGNYMGGTNADARATLDDILTFRRNALAIPGMLPDDFIYLRGVQEDLLSKLQQLHFAPNPKEVAAWLTARYADEIDSLLKCYGSSLVDVQRVVREGTMGMTKWSLFLKTQIRNVPGHEKFFTVLRRAALTDLRNPAQGNLLFVHAGINPALGLMEQGDHFWWASKNFNTLGESYQPFKTVIRGHDPEHQGLHVGKYSISLDQNCGFGGPLAAALLSDQGEILEFSAA